MTDRETKIPNKEKVSSIVSYANQYGLLLLSNDIKSKVIHFLTSLVITEEELNKGLAILEQAFKVNQ